MTGLTELWIAHSVVRSGLLDLRGLQELETLDLYGCHLINNMMQHGGVHQIAMARLDRQPD